MKELREIAKLSGNSLDQMLKEELAKLASPVPPLDCQCPPDPMPLPQVEKLSPGDLFSSPGPHSMGSSELTAVESSFESIEPCVNSPLNKNLTDLPSLPALPLMDNGKPQTPFDLNPPSVQRVVVEHVVRSSESSSHYTTPNRLHTFSEKSPCPNNEADYDTWRTSVEILMKDPSVSDLHCMHRILDSLFPPAAEMVKHLGPQAQPSAYLSVLDSAYGTVENDGKLLARFMNTLQDDGEKPSLFLHVCLSMAMRRGGVSAHEFDRQLLKQFCRGCWDNILITNLQLEQRKVSPLLWQIRDPHASNSHRNTMSSITNIFNVTRYIA